MERNDPKKQDDARYEELKTPEVPKIKLLQTI